MPYRSVASKSYGPAQARRVSAVPYLERLQGVSVNSTAATQMALESAALRRQQQVQQEAATRQAQLDTVTANIQARVKQSQDVTMQAKNDYAAKYAQINATTAARQITPMQLNQVQPKLGAAGYDNPAFASRNAKNAASMAPNNSGNYPLQSYKWGGFGLTTAKGTQGRFTGFLNALAATGYKVNDVQTYANRPVRGGTALSEHAKGYAMDINPAQNPMGSSLVTNMPRNVQAMAARYGLVWGGSWRSKKDAMHFSTTGL